MPRLSLRNLRILASNLCRPRRPSSRWIRGVGAEGKPLQSAGLSLSADDFVNEARAAGFIDTPDLYDATVLLLKSMSRAASTDGPFMPPAGTQAEATNKSQDIQVQDGE